uniref:DUF4283 domain-containing protein n=1 Tax=Leersia perrieri TaxID=77586 RepID=A0A0D9W2E2_9ORYZ
MEAPGDLVTPSPPKGWDFTPGKFISSSVQRDFGSTVHFSPWFGSCPFFLVVDFVRFNFHLTPNSIAIALSCCLGGSAHGFLVSHLKGNSFQFQVCSKSVGLLVVSLRNYVCQDYHCRFFLWRDAGPNWKWELSYWEQEEEAQWTIVSRKTRSFDRHVLRNESSARLLKGQYQAQFDKHDELANRRYRAFSQEGWILILGVPPDFKTDEMVEKIVNVFDTLIWWHKHDRMLGRLLVKAKYTSRAYVPAKIVVGKSQEKGENGESLTFFTFLLNGQFTEHQINEQAAQAAQAAQAQAAQNVHAMQVEIEDNQHGEVQDSMSVEDFSFDDFSSSLDSVCWEQGSKQIIPFGAPTLAVPFATFPIEACIAFAESVIKPLLWALDPPLQSSISTNLWTGMSTTWTLKVPNLKEASIPCALSSIATTSTRKRVTRALPFSIPSDNRTQQPRAKRTKTKQHILVDTL